MYLIQILLSCNYALFNSFLSQMHSNNFKLHQFPSYCTVECRSTQIILSYTRIPLSCTQIILICTRIPFTCTQIILICTCIPLSSTQIILSFTRFSLRCTQIILSYTCIPLRCIQIILSYTRIPLTCTQIILSYSTLVSLLQYCKCTQIPLFTYTTHFRSVYVPKTRFQAEKLCTVAVHFT